MLARDHMAFDAEVLHVAAELHLQLVHHLTLLQYQTGDRLSRELGFTFDNDFTGNMMTAHQQLIAVTKGEILHGASPQVQALAGQALPMLEKHLAMLRSVAGAG